MPGVWVPGEFVDMWIQPFILSPPPSHLLALTVSAAATALSGGRAQESTKRCGEHTGQ